MAVSPDGAYAYVTNSFSDTVSVINTAATPTPTPTPTPTVATIPVGSGPSSVAVTPNGAYAYVTNGVSNSVSVISTAHTTANRLHFGEVDWLLVILVAIVIFCVSGLLYLAYDYSKGRKSSKEKAEKAKQ